MGNGSQRIRHLRRIRAATLSHVITSATAATENIGCSFGQRARNDTGLACALRRRDDDRRFTVDNTSQRDNESFRFDLVAHCGHETTQIIR